jgi:hypothetical protein
MSFTRPRHLSAPCPMLAQSSDQRIWHTGARVRLLSNIDRAKKLTAKENGLANPSRSSCDFDLFTCAAAADGLVCRRKCCPSISANRMCGMALSSFDADLGTSRASDARRYRTGTATRARSGETSTSSAPRRRFLMTEGDTRDSASASFDRRAGVAKRPRASQENSVIGGRRIGSNRIRWRSGASLGIGLRAKEPVRTKPRGPARRSAGIEIAIVPENDSAKRTISFKTHASGQSQGSG